METFYTSVDYNELEANLANIVAMNTSDGFDDDTEDYDLDCDLNDLYNFERYAS